MLNTHRHGDDLTGTPLLIAHGLFGSARNWGAIAKRLSRQRPVVTVDMRNHGASPWHAEHGYEDMAADLAHVLALDGRPHDVLGHSMGGKAAMALALSQPQAVRRLVVADIAPVPYGHSQIPLIEAMQAVDLEAVTQRRDADAQLLKAIPEAPVRAFLLQSLDLTGDSPRWRLNLEALRDQMDHVMGFPDPDGRFENPTLFLSGGASDYVRPEHHEVIRPHFPEAEFETLPGVGHWLHAEAPGPFLEALERFLDA